MPRPIILFLKAQIRGGARADLFATPVTVSPYVRNGRLARGYVAIRQKAPGPNPSNLIPKNDPISREATQGDIPAPRTRPAVADRMGFAWEASELPGMTRDDARNILRDEGEARTAGVFGNEDGPTLDHARRLLGLPAHARVIAGDRPLTTGKWRVERGDRREGLSNWQPTMEEAIAEARQWEANRQAIAQQKAEQAEREVAIAAKVHAGTPLTDADLDVLGLKHRQARFDYLSPVVQRLFGISKAKVREAMGDALRRAVNGMNTAEHWVADPRKALAHAAAYAAKRSGTLVRPFAQ